MASLSSVVFKTLGRQRGVYTNVSRCVTSRYISTSDGKKESVVAPHPVAQEAAAKNSATVDEATKKKWVSFGYDPTDETEDRVTTHAFFFMSVTMVLVVGTWWRMYMPDSRLTDWAQREAYVELRRREREGLPLIDGNLVDPSTIVLPSDEELGDMEIII